MTDTTNIGDGGALHDEAVQFYREARFAEAAAKYEDLCRLDSANAQRFLDLGRCQFANRDYEQAASALRTAIDLYPEYFDAWHILGASLLGMGEIDQAQNALRNACKHGGDRIPNHEDYCHSAHLPEAAEGVRPWRGEPLAGKRLLVHANQGIGDTIQNARHFRTLRAEGADVFVHCQPVLFELFRFNNLANGLVSAKQSVPDCDYVVPVSALTHIVAKRGLSNDTIGDAYLMADPTMVAHWQKNIVDVERFNVGLVWSGNPSHPSDHSRSMASVFLEPFLGIKEIQFYCLKKDTAPNDPLLHDPRCTALRDDVDGFQKIAAAMTALDLTITVDTAPVHLAGAMAVPAWLLMARSGGDFRWFPRPGEAPLYQSVEIHRLTKSNDWHSLTRKLAPVLKARAQAKSANKQIQIADVRPTPPPSADAPLVATGPVRTRRCRYGIVSYYATDTYVGRSFDLYGEFSEGEVGLFRHIVRPGQTVLDVGANIGAHTLFFAHAVGRRGKVLAFEPQRRIFGLLSANASLNDLPQIHAIHGALGRQAGTITVPQPDYAVTGNFGGLSLSIAAAGEPVDLLTLDDLAPVACHFIKVDAEGMEADVLAGGEATIRRLRPWLYVENDRKNRSAALIGLIKSFGYRLYWHLPPYYNPGNFFANTENVFGRTVSCNLLCLPEEVDQDLSGLREVTSTDDWMLGG